VQWSPSRCLSVITATPASSRPFSSI
jgi:hypothetical protein